MINRQILFLIFLILPIYFGNIYSQPKLYINEGKEEYSLGGYLSILEDKDQKLTINEVASDSLKNNFTYVNQQNINLRFTLSAYWVRFIIMDTTSSQSSVLNFSQNTSTWILMKNEPVLEDVRLYYKDLNSDENKFIERRGGSIIPVKDKVIKISDFIADIPIQKNLPDTVYLRVSTKSQLILSFDLYSTGEYIIYSVERNFFHAIIFGINLLLLIYNIILYFSIKDEVYIYYILYILFFSLTLFTKDGYYFDIIGRTFHHDYYILPLCFGTLTGVTWLFFTNSFLDTKLTIPWAYKSLTYISLITPILFISTFLFQLQMLTVFWAVSLLGNFLYGIFICIVALIKGNKMSKYYLFAISGVVVGVTVSVMARNGFLFIPFNFWTHNAYNLGILWEAIILGGTIGYRFTEIRAEKEKEKAFMRNQIASDLHDEIGSNLSTISLQSQMLIKTKDLDITSKEKLIDIAKIAEKTTDIMRDIVWFINPFHDKSENFMLHLKEFTSKILINQNYTFNAEDENIFEVIKDLNIRRQIYLCFKEALNNIVKHSEASEVIISISIENNKIIIFIADNGKGFDEDKILKGTGLNSLRNRAFQIDANILIEKNGDKGTKITLEVPLK